MPRQSIFSILLVFFVSGNAHAIEQCRVESCGGLGYSFCIYAGAAKKNLIKLDHAYQALKYLEINDGITCDADLERINELLNDRHKQFNTEAFDPESFAKVLAKQQKRKGVAAAPKSDELHQCHLQLAKATVLLDQLKESAKGLDPKVQHQLEDLQKALEESGAVDAK